MKLKVRLETLLDQLQEIEQNHEGILEQAFRSIEVCRNTLFELKKEVIAQGFDSITSEIDFFKITKQVPLVQLIYFSEIHSFEIQFPKADRTTQIKYIKKKINKLNRFFLYNLDFGQYVNSGATHFDKEYYTRDFLNSYYITTSKFYFQDPDFSTPRDMLLGKFKAYNSLINYLEERLFRLKSTINGKNLNFHNTEKISWPFSNTDWVELVYALSAAGLAKHNKLSIIKISKMLQLIFDFEPKDIYKTFQELKVRKTSRTLFLEHLIASLISLMNKSEE